jgi:hypothetical protein
MAGLCQRRSNLQPFASTCLPACLPVCLPQCEAANGGMWVCVHSATGGPSLLWALFARPRQGSAVPVEFTSWGTFSGFLPTSGTVTFPAGQTSQSVPFSWDCDSTDNDDRVVSILIFNPGSPVYISRGNGLATLTVQDDDAVRFSGWQGPGRLGGKDAARLAGAGLQPRTKPPPAPLTVLCSNPPILCLPLHSPLLLQPPAVSVTGPAPVNEGNIGTITVNFQVSLSAPSVGAPYEGGRVVGPSPTLGLCIAGSLSLPPMLATTAFAWRPVQSGGRV